MELTFKGVDISTEEKFVSYINSLNTAIMKQNAMNEIKQDLYDVSYLKKRYRKIVARNAKALFMAEHECLKCVYFQRLVRKYQANCKCLLEESIDVCVKNMVNENFTEEQARSYLKEMLPKLDYWNRYDELSDNGQFEEFKRQLVNDLHIDGLPRVGKLNALVGKYVNLEYTLPNYEKDGENPELLIYKKR